MLAEIRAPRLIIASVLPLALLAACGGDAGEEGEGAIADDGREASGEILPSSISDEMIATDQLSSQPPLMRDEPVPATDAAADDEAQDDAAAANDGGDAGPAETVPAPPLSPEDIDLPED